MKEERKEGEKRGGKSGQVGRCKKGVCKTRTVQNQAPTILSELSSGSGCEDPVRVLDRTINDRCQRQHNTAESTVLGDWHILFGILVPCI